MRSLTLGVLATLALTTTAWAQPVALIFGNEDYDEYADVRNADAVPDIADALSREGVEVITGRNVTAEELRRGLARFETGAEQADTLIVVLAGQFVHSSVETYFLPSDAARGSLAEVERSDPLALSTVNGYLAERPGRAILVLATEEPARDRTGAFLSAGIDEYDGPQGVTVVRGDIDDTRRFLRDVLAEPGASLGESRDMTITGFAPDTLVVLPQRANRPSGSASDVLSNAERRLDIADWREALDKDTVAAYRAYIDAHPGGNFVDQARQRIGEVRQTPEQRAEDAESALNLSRDARREIQRDLSILDYNTRGIDGIFGPGTRNAVRNWQQAQGYEVTGYLNRGQIDSLDRQALNRARELEAEAERRRRQQEADDRAYWQATGARGGEANYRRYLDRYPDGIYSDDAQDALAVIEDRKRRETSALDTEAWDRARQTNTIQSYRRYLDDMPNGRFREEAQSRIAQIRNQQSQRNQAAQAEENALNLNPITRRVVEQRLNQAGYDPGTIDGVFDADTRRAIRRYQSSRGLPQTGYLSEAVVVRLLADSVRQIFD